MKRAERIDRTSVTPPTAFPALNGTCPSAAAARDSGARRAERAKRAANRFVATRTDAAVMAGPGNFGDAIAIAHVGTAPRRKRVRQRRLALARHFRAEVKTGQEPDF